MENINNTLKRLTHSKSFKQRYEDMKREILENKEIRSFLQMNEAEMQPGVFERGLGKLYEYKSQSTKCEQCPSLQGCINLMKGYEPSLVLQNGNVAIEYHRCRKGRHEDERRNKESLIQSLYVPREILEASFGTVVSDHASRIAAVRASISFVEGYEPGVKMKGLYIHGKFGVGKSFLLGAIANQLAERNISSYMVYVPEFFREMKNSLSDNSLHGKIETIKKAPVLMLDDIGAETMSSWARDEILGTILQFRMLENLPTFFTSNFNYDELQHHLTYSQRGEEEKIKAARMMERIRYLTKPIELDGKNRRV
jgi:primosomal protein DnaI